MTAPGQSNESVCCGCGVVLPSVQGPTHRYMTASPACWQAYGEVLAREYGDRARAKFHRLSVDAYAIQHPGTPSPQAIQSVAVHLCRLGLIIEDGWGIERANAAMLEIHKVERRFRWLEPPRSRGQVTVADVLATRDADEHLRAVERWANSCWQAWSEHHATIRGWLPPGGSQRARVR